MTLLHFLRRHWYISLAFVFFFSGIIFHVSALTPATLTIIDPPANTTISGSSLKAKFTLANFTLVDPSSGRKPLPNQGHLLIWLDQTTLNSDSAIKSFSPEYTFTSLKTGPHTLVVEAVKSDNSPFTPPLRVATNFTSVPLSYQSSSPLAQEPIFQLSIITVILLGIAMYVTNSHLRELKKTSPKSHPKKAKKLK